MVVYQALNIKTGKIYVGQTYDFERRKERHIKYALSGSKVCPKFYSALRKYGQNAFEWSILLKCNTRKELNLHEARLIEELDTINNGYNVSKGGRSGPPKLKKSTIKKIKASNKLTWSDPLFLQKHSELMKGKIKHSDDTKEHLRQLQLGRKMSKASSKKKSKTIKELYKDPEFKGKVTKSIQDAFDNKIYQYDNSLNFIKLWPSHHLAHIEGGCSRFKKTRKFIISKGCIWSRQELNTNDLEEVNQYIEYLKTYKFKPRKNKI